MSQFYASIQGGRKEKTCQGHKSTGIKGHIRGWDFGIKTFGYVNGTEEYFEVWKTGGSNGSVRDVLLLRFKNGQVEYRSKDENA